MLADAELQKRMNGAIKWIQEYVDSSKKKGVVIGNSGGKDSATVIAMATKALGKENVLTVSMPCQSILQDSEDAELVAKTFGVKFLTVDVTKVFEEWEKEVNTILVDTQLSVEAKINAKPRIRMFTLYGIAQTLDYLVLGTGNLCEAMVGYTTKWGDSAYDFNPIANFTVDEVLEIGRILGVPKKILEKAPSDGLGIKTDEEKMGITYSQIAEMIETGVTEERAKQNILSRYQNSKHKREKTAIYEFERRNFLKEMK